MLIYKIYFSLLIFFMGVAYKGVPDAVGVA